MRYLILLQEANLVEPSLRFVCSVESIINTEHSIVFPDYMHSLSDNHEPREMQITCEIAAVNSVREEDHCSINQCCAVGLKDLCNVLLSSKELW